MHGTSALKRNRQEQVRYREKQTIVYRAKSIPMKEKLIYLLMIFLCVAIAGTILWRYAQIYQMNNNIYKLETSIRQFETDNISLKQQIDKMNDLSIIKQGAEKNGLVPANPEQVIRVTGTGSSSAQGKSQESSTP